jgi:hypothetical protein
MSDASDPNHFIGFYNIKFVRVITEHDPNCDHLWEFAMKWREIEKCSRCGGLKLWNTEREFNPATMEKVEE